MPTPEPYYLRDPRVALAGESSLLVAIGTEGHRLEMCPSEALYELLRLLRHPTQASTLASLLNLPRAAMDEMLSTLESRGIVVSGALADLTRITEPPARGSKPPMCDTLVLGISGTVQAATTIALAHSLKGIVASDVHIVLTRAARRFLPRDVVSYFGLSVWTDEFRPIGSVNVPHIWLAQKAALILILPASARTIFKLAHGACSDLLSLVVAATKAPVVVAPSMNPAMFENPAVRRNISQLRHDGIFVLEPSLGLEVSNSSRQALEFMGVGLGRAGLPSILETVLAAHARRGRQPVLPSE